MPSNRKKKVVSQPAAKDGADPPPIPAPSRVSAGRQAADATTESAFAGSQHLEKFSALLSDLHTSDAELTALDTSVLQLAAKITDLRARSPNTSDLLGARAACAELRARLDLQRTRAAERVDARDAILDGLGSIGALVESAAMAVRPEGRTASFENIMRAALSPPTNDDEDAGADGDAGADTPLWLQSAAAVLEEGKTGQASPIDGTITPPEASHDGHTKQTPSESASPHTQPVTPRVQTMRHGEVETVATALPAAHMLPASDASTAASPPEAVEAISSFERRMVERARSGRSHDPAARRSETPSTAGSPAVPQASSSPPAPTSKAQNPVAAGDAGDSSATARVTSAASPLKAIVDYVEPARQALEPLFARTPSPAEVLGPVLSRVPSRQAMREAFPNVRAMSASELGLAAAHGLDQGRLRLQKSLSQGHELAKLCLLAGRGRLEESRAQLNDVMHPLLSRWTPNGGSALAPRGDAARLPQVLRNALGRLTALASAARVSAWHTFEAGRFLLVERTFTVLSLRPPAIRLPSFSVHPSIPGKGRTMPTQVTAAVSAVQEHVGAYAALLAARASQLYRPTTTYRARQAGLLLGFGVPKQAEAWSGSHAQSSSLPKPAGGAAVPSSEAASAAASQEEPPIGVTVPSVADELAQSLSTLQRYVVALEPSALAGAAAATAVLALSAARLRAGGPAPTKPLPTPPSGSASLGATVAPPPALPRKASPADMTAVEMERQVIGLARAELRGNIAMRQRV